MMHVNTDTKVLPFLAFLCLTISVVNSRQSSWIMEINDKWAVNYTLFPNYLFEGGYVRVHMICYTPGEGTKLNVMWHLEQVHCMEEIYDQQTYVDRKVVELALNAGATKNQTKKVSKPPSNPTKYKILKFQNALPQTVTCQQTNFIDLVDQGSDPYTIAFVPQEKGKPTLLQDIQPHDVNLTKVRNRVASAWTDGMYHFMLRVSAQQPNATFQAKVFVEMHGSWGYLAAIDWPMLPVSGSLALCYLMVSTTWVIVWAKAHQHTYKIHVLIGCIAVAGALSHTLQFIEYATLNSNGQGVDFILWFARIVDSVQLSLVYLVLMVVSIGYGITRPTINRCVLGAALLLSVTFLVLLILKEIILDINLRVQYTVPALAKVVIWFESIVALIIPGWIFIGSISTVAHLHRRQHSEKLKIFILFMIVCIAVFIAMFVVTVINMDWMQDCRSDWEHQWLFLSFSKIVALVLMVVLMMLWRPADEATSYAFSPLVNIDDEEEEVEFEKLALEPI